MNETTVATRNGTSSRLLNKVAIVTGATSGIGRAIALAYAAEGAKVVCADLHPIVAKACIKKEDEKATHEVIGENGGQSLFVKCDVANSQDVRDMVAKTVQSYGRLDIMVNNAGIAPDCTPTSAKPTHETDDDIFDLTMRVNARSNFLGCKYAGRQMIEQEPHPCGDRGWIINIASGLGLVGQPGAVSYSSSKGAIVNMTRTVALDYAPYRIHCNAICPGFVTTPLSMAFAANEHILGMMESAHPFRGLGQPEDIAKVAVFLASEDASWVTGVPMPVDGGFLAR